MFQNIGGVRLKYKLKYLQRITLIKKNSFQNSQN